MKRFYLVWILIAPAAWGTSLHWFSALDHFNFAADNRPMDADFRFELGVFRDGFVPTAANRSQWSAHWAPAQREVYNEGGRWYSGFLTVQANDAPFVPGAPTWVWGFSGDAASGDWILFRSEDWRWPRADPTNPLVRHWNAKDADIVLIGSVAQNRPELLQAAAVEEATPPPTSFGQWVVENNRSDRREDLVEFVTGGKRPPVQLTRAAGTSDSGMMEVRLARLADRRLSHVQLEVSEDLKQWRPYHAYANFREATTSELIYEVDSEAGDAPQLFFRARYEP